MIEFVLVVLAFFLLLLFLIVFFRKDIFSFNDGVYTPIAQGACQRGTRYEVFQCTSKNGCLDKFGNLTFNFKLQSFSCFTTPVESLSSNVPPIRSLNKNVSLNGSAKPVISRSNCNVLDNSCKGTRTVIEDCSSGCLEHTQFGARVKGGVNLDTIPLRKEIIVNTHKVYKKSPSLIYIDGTLYNYADAHSFFNYVKKIEECEDTEKCLESKPCNNSNVYLSTKCEGEHLEEVKKKCSTCIVIDPKYAETLHIDESIKSLLRGKVVLVNGSEYLSSNDKGNLNWESSPYSVVRDKKSVRLIFKVVGIMGPSEVLVESYGVFKDYKGWVDIDNSIGEKDRKRSVLSYENGVYSYDGIPVQPIVEPFQ